VKVTVGRYVFIDLDEAQTPSYCRAAAELPRAIVIPAQRAHAGCGGPESTNPTSA
jgi:hypothetical protein